MSVEPHRDMGKKATLAGTALQHFDAVCQGYRDVTGEIIGFSIRGPKVRGGEFLVTIRGLDEEGGPVVAFHTSDTLDGLWSTLWARYKSEDLKWRADTWER